MIEMRWIEYELIHGDVETASIAKKLQYRNKSDNPIFGGGAPNYSDWIDVPTVTIKETE